ncbi:helix-turn-helix domain-containing protein [Embleya hyalina]|uniref:Transcriptional regulator n=1 Tax=Embleya hyalina TaxID=516124 RepID=A0A401YRZ4_9ACTN|nr:helix-turn-helix transcriptional regulator [Embleya hyalina]GCD97380.1 transcriptional regulator [Embleya hyalina]
MASRTVLTERQKRLGSELRRMRTSADMSAEYAAGLLGVDRGKISNMESGSRSISAERLRTLACNCACTDERYLEALVAMAQSDAKGWWDRYRGTLPQGLLDIAELEAFAIGMRVANTVHIPGLLQTSDHALSVFRVAVPVLPDHEIGLRLAHRAERQQVLDRQDPPTFRAVVHEAALRMRFGGGNVVRAQLAHLIEVAERPNVTLRVIPFEAGAFPGAGQSVLYAEGPVPLLDTVQIDSSHGPTFMWAENQLAKYRAQLDWSEHLSLSPEQSRDFIHKIARQV